ncbi:cytochrome P450 [Xanthomonas prunicola]|uniref:cytochrome P450 n=1 Tax=Xanthomonas prunicola TaxID=2053930 RepID=UPI0021B337AC|nr:cytochrome P450 [Xanthomonas prunicola]UXA70279.1 cytochrome P450 [Xanthomonas prunicola]
MLPEPAVVKDIDKKEMVVAWRRLSNELTQAQLPGLQMTEALELMLNGLRVAAIPPELANLCDAACQCFSNNSYAASRKFGHRRMHQMLRYVLSIEQHVAPVRIGEGTG